MTRRQFTHQDGPIRELLSAARTYYVRTDGDDANTGLVNDAGGAFLTVQAAVDAVAMLDVNGQTVTIQVADGTYTDTVTLKNVVGVAAAGTLIIQGNTTTPANVIISTTSASCFTSQVTTPWRIQYMKLQTTTSGNCLYALAPGANISFRDLNFGACAAAHIRVATNSYIAKVSGTNYTISGGAAHHWYVEQGATLRDNGSTITISGTPAFSTAFAFATTAGTMTVGAITFSGSATGKRYDIALNGVINSAGGTLPGDAAGTTATGGQYA